jgi:hypothetical protein
MMKTLARFAQVLAQEDLRNGPHLGGSPAHVLTLQHRLHRESRTRSWGRNLHGLLDPRRSDSLPKGLEWLRIHNVAAQTSQGLGTAVLWTPQGSLQSMVVS